MNRLFAWFCGLVAFAAASASAAEPARDPSAPPHPTVFLTAADVRLAQTNIARFEWARETADTIQRQAETWLAKPDDWFLRNMPSAGACFAYGFTGCPICGASWGTWGGARASFDRPGQVTCGQGHVLPDADHPDAGTGYVGKDKRIHYFVGSYNAWAVETLTFQAADSLAYAYSLTGEERFAAKASLILDAIAAIYPACTNGSWDYPSRPPSGRLDRPWYQVARVLVHYVDQYDQVFASPALDAPSVKPGLTRRQNIETNLLQNGAAYCYAQSQAGALHNGEADYIRGALAVGSCLGLPEYVRWAVDGPFGIYSLVENNLDRDGQYYETSTLYAGHSRNLYLTFAEPLLNYRGSAYPQGVNLYAHPKFRRFLTLLDTSLDCAGHSPRFGDSAPDTARIIPPPRPFDPDDYSALEVLYARSEDPASQRQLAALLSWLAEGDASRTRVGSRRSEPSPTAAVPWLASHEPPLNGQPPHPGPLPLRGGEGASPPALEKPGASASANALPSIPPLPFGRGEGRGEGSRLPPGINVPTPGERAVEANHDAERACAAFEERRWLLSHARPLPEPGKDAFHRVPFSSSEATDAVERVPTGFLRQLTGCALFGQKGIGILRQGAGPTAQALLLRFGPSLNHGHCDDLNLNFFARGYELTYDLGYGLGSTHTQVGWSHQTASHNLVVVDERSQREAAAGSGGSLYLFADLPGVKLVEASSEASYAAQGVSLYRRTLALIGSPSGGYAVDLFRVKGGHQHDYLFHALADRADLTGVSLGEEEPGSLAGADFSWGAQQLNDGDVAGHPNRPYWNPPPGNGYGFLVQPRRGSPTGEWSAQWQVDPTNGVRLFMAAQPGTELISALAPGIYPRLPKARYVIARRKGTDLDSQFAAVIEPNDGTSRIGKVERLSLRQPDSPETGGFSSLSPSEGERAGVRGPSSLVDSDATKGHPGPVALKITRQDGVTDLVYSSADTTARQAGGCTFAGRFIHAQLKDGKLLALSLVGARQFDGLGWRVQPQRDAWEGPVTATDYEANSVTTTVPLPADGSLNGQVILFSNPRYSRNTAYRITRIEAGGTGTRIRLDGTLLLGKGQVDAVKDATTLTSRIPHEYARTVNGKAGSGFFRGKRIRTAAGATAEIATLRYGQPMTLTLKSTKDLHPGDVFYYDDVQPGDQFTIILLASLVQTGPGAYESLNLSATDLQAPVGQAARRLRQGDPSPAR